MKENDIGKIIVDCAYTLHKDLGPGLLESVYEVLLAHKIQQRGLKVERQVSVPIQYEDIKFDEGFRLDLFVEHKVIVELKCVEAVKNTHKKQVLTYLKMTNTKRGFLINFNVTLIKNGITRIIDGKLD